MSTDPRLFSLLDEFDEFTYKSTLRIPPLQDPLPFTPFSRPSPLEPNARVSDGTHNATAKLTSRRKALAEAKLIGENVTSSPCGNALSDHKLSLGKDVDEHVKRPKSDSIVRGNDFVQLPKPMAKAQETNLPPFKPVPVLRKLHEPPPSAAIFPPITSDVVKLDEARLNVVKALSPATLPNPKKERKPRRPKTNYCQENSTKEQGGLVKRVTLRQRHKWTEAETQYLLEGVAIFGPGKWKKILSHPGLKFSAERTTVDLKDRYRTCRMNQEKDFIRTRSLQTQHFLSKTQVDLKVLTTGHSDSDAVSPKLLSTGVHFALSTIPSNDLMSPDSRLLADALKQPGSLPLITAEPCLSPTGSRQSKDMKSRELETRLPQTNRPPHGMLPPRWSKEEDVNLAMGYQRHGFKWTAITRDPELNLSHRLGSQVRDRFRLKFSDLYEAPLPTPESKNTLERKAPKHLKTKTSNGDDESMKKDVGTSAIKKGEMAHDKDSALESHQDSLAPPSPPQLVISPSIEIGIGSERTRISKQHDGMLGLAIRCELGRPERMTEQCQEALSSSDERSRQSSTTADEARNLGITGLLNDAEQEVSRLPPIKYPYDDWRVDSVTLPPLLWEDMAARPIFDLD